MFTSIPVFEVLEQKANNRLRLHLWVLLYGTEAKSEKNRAPCPNLNLYMSAPHNKTRCRCENPNLVFTFTPSYSNTGI